MIDTSAIEAELEGRWTENRLEPTLDRIAALLQLAGNPHLRVPAIHITGTNGKSTTARMIDELLRASGVRTGRYTSPHLESVRERIVIAGEHIDPVLFTEIYDDLRPLIRTVDTAGPVPLSFFEIVTAMGLIAFARARVDVAIVEVGMGGTWDATNVVDGRVCVMTPISLDHVDFLGPDEVAIATEKSGIVKCGSTLVTAPQSNAVIDVLTARADAVDADVLHTEDAIRIIERVRYTGRQVLHLRSTFQDYPDIQLAVVGLHQAQNACTALAAVETFLSSIGIEPVPQQIRRGFAAVTAPGRLETVSQNPTTVIDVSHNPAGMSATVTAFLEAFAGHKPVVVLAVLGDKDIDGILAALVPLAWHLVATENGSPRHLPADRLADKARVALCSGAILVEPDLAAAVKTARALALEAGEGTGVLITGSVVTAGEARVLLA